MTTPSSTDTRMLAEDLRRVVDGEVHFDDMTRALYSTDASIYQIKPVGVVIPRSEEDVIAVVEMAHERKIAVLPRGAGSSLAGQAVGHAIIMDFSKYMRHVLEICPEESWVRVQPGIILDELNNHLVPSGLHFSPDPSTSNRGNVGGALGNNSCGAHSIVWGKTVDNVKELRVVLSNGNTANLGSVNGQTLNAKMSGTGLESNIYRTLIEIGNTNRKEILKRYPKIMRRVSGYNLEEIKPDRIDMARFVVGSEGTLLTITEAKLLLVPRPKITALAVLHFHELLESMEATVITLEMEPAAVELIDSLIIRQARTNLEYARMMDFIDGDPEAILLVEFAGDTESQLNSRLDKLEERMRKNSLGYAVHRVINPEEQAKVWAVRKAGLGLMMSTPSTAKPLPFVEDTAVAPEVLPEYISRFDEIVKSHDTTAGYYGHASVGCLHIRPLIDLKLQEGVDRMVSIASQVSDLVLDFEGAMSGEHGDGLVRSGWIEKMFGQQIYEALRQVKTAFDPKGIMNPGKIIDPPPMTDNLRIGPGYRTLDLSTQFRFREQGSFAKAIEMCNGQAACRKVLSGTMCPSYMVTRDEKHSTRGRANALRAAISGTLPQNTLTSKNLHDVLDLCLECKACKSECPSNVDMAKLKYDFLDRYHKVHGFTIRDRVLGNLSSLSRLGSFFSPLSNWLLSSGVFKQTLQNYCGIDQRRSLPLFRSQTFVQWFRARGGSHSNSSSLGKVVLFPDTFMNYNQPELGKAATRVLEKLGYQVVVPSVRCCGRPELSKGMIDKTRANAQFNVEALSPYIENGAKVVGIEPSCILSFRDEYLDLLEGHPKANSVADNSMLIEEFLTHASNQDSARLEFKTTPGKVLFHGHCHQRSIIGSRQAMEILHSMPGIEPQEIQSGCCGMAGSFGYETEHYDISMKIGEQILFPTIRSQGLNTTVVSEGMSCREQIEHGTGVKAKHLVEVLADAL